MPAHRDACDVLIVGAGPVGLALAIELGQRGVSCLVVEQNDRVGTNPRAKTTNVRTREHLRRWGIDTALRDASPIPPDYPSNIIFMTRLDGHELARFENAFHTRRGRNDLYSSEAQWVPQFVLEEVLRRHAATLPTVTIRFQCRLESIDEHTDGIDAAVIDLASGARDRVACRYLVGADGARSTVRGLIGARMQGDGSEWPNLNVVFRSPGLAQRIRFGQAIQYWLINPDLPSVFGPMDMARDLWYFIFTKLDAAVTAAPGELIRRALGCDIPLEIVATDPWVARRLVASHYARDRIFLAGDACHLHPPFGGYGMNMGIGDAVDLGWKLAATLQGWGGAELLASYEAERRPVHVRVMDEAMYNYGAVGNELTRPEIEDVGLAGERIRAEVGAAIRRTKIREFDTLGVVLGYHYGDSPIVVPDGSTCPEGDFREYRPSARPGCLAPHLWLSDGSSLYDALGPGFTLLMTQAGRDVSRLLTIVERMRVPLKVLAPAHTRLRDLYQADFVLIRPDQHVAWRGNSIPDDVEALLDRIRGAATSPARVATPLRPAPRGASPGLA